MLFFRDNLLHSKVDAVTTAVADILRHSVHQTEAYRHVRAALDVLIVQDAAVQKKLNLIEKRLDLLEGRLKRIARRLGPGLLSVNLTGENFKMDMIMFNLVLPPASAPDVVGRELAMSISGGDFVVQQLSGSTLEVTGMEGPQGSNVVFQLIDIDDAGNRSEPSTLSVVLEDTFAPPAPGQMGVVFVGERHEEPVADEPPADEPPADEPPADEPPADEPPADEPPADEPPADEPPADEPPADEPPADEPPADEPPADEPPADEPPADAFPPDEPPADDEGDSEQL